MEDGSPTPGQISLTGGTLTIANGAGTDLTVFGRFVNTNATAIVTTGATLAFEAGSEYHDNISASSTIPTASWDVNSTCFLDTWTFNTVVDTKNNLAGQIFGNFTIANTAAGTTVATLLPSGGTMTCLGNFRYSATGRSLNLVSTPTATTILNVGKDFIYSGTSTFTLNAGNTAAVTLNVTGNLNKTGAGTFIANANIASAVTLNIVQDFISTQSFTLNTGANGPVNLNLTGNFNNSGAFTPGTSTVTFNGGYPIHFRLLSYHIQYCYH